MQISRKRPFEHEEVARTVKIPRTSFGGHQEVERAVDESTKTARSPLYRDIKNDNTMSSSINATKSAATDASSDRGNMSNSKSSHSCTSSATKSFRHQPLEEYLKAEALRLWFIRNGLHHKEPRADIQLFNEDNLAPYVQYWQDCFSHWSPLMSSDSTASTNTNRRHRSFDCTSPVFGQNYTNTVKDRSLELKKPDFQPTIAKWGYGLTTKDEVREIVQSEVRKQLDDYDMRVIQSEDTQMNITPQSYQKFLDHVDSTHPQSKFVDNARPDHRSPLSSKDFDDSNEIAVQTPSVR